VRCASVVEPRIEIGSRHPSRHQLAEIAVVFVGDAVRFRSAATTAAVRRSICNGSLVEQQLILRGSDDAPLILDAGTGGGTCVAFFAALRMSETIAANASSVPVTTAPRGEVSRPGESSLCAHSATRSTAPPSFHPTASRGLRISGEGVSRGV
jgi:hypothetical protein